MNEMVDYNLITDWNDAYANRDHVADAPKIIEEWERRAPAFRQAWGAGEGGVETDLAYGKLARERMDIFYPAGQPKGLFVFIHGGYWMAFDKNSWSHLAEFALQQGWAVAIPSYSLCPDVRICDITQQAGAAIEYAANRISGPLCLAGHSAGGHLVSRMGCEGAPLSVEVAARITQILSISGVHDLRPLLNLELNQTLRLDREEAERESPALLTPRAGVVIDCIVGGDERPEFIRQNALLANIWIGLGAKTSAIVEPGKNHFNIINELSAPNHGWLARVLG